MLISDLRPKWLLNGQLESIVNSMSLDEKVGAVFISFFYGDTLTDHAKETIKLTKLGNVILYSWANDLTNPKKVKELTAQINKYTKEILGIPSHFFVDQEGGIVSRLNTGFTVFPGNMALAATRDSSLAKQVGIAMGKEMRAVGISQTLAPVVDINNNPKNPVIGTRSFSDNPEIVIKFASQLIEGLATAGILATLKHFPGHGNVQVDSHKSLPVINIDRMSIDEFELKPFIALQDQADAIMTAHVLLPQIDPNNCVTASSIFLINILREDNHYNKAIISDSLVMKGLVPQQTSFDEAIQNITNAAIKSFNAGADLLILGGLEWADFKEPNPNSPETNQLLVQKILSNFKKAIEEKIISEKKLNESVKRTLYLKHKALLEGKEIDLSQVKCQEHVEIAKTVARDALTLVSSYELLSKYNTTLSGRKIVVIAPEHLDKNLNESLIDYPSISIKTFNNENFEKITNEINEADLAIFLSFKERNSIDQNVLIEKLAQKIPENKLIVVGLRNPQDVMQNESYKKFLVYLTYSHSIVSLKALFDALEKQSTPTGILPMEL